MIGRLVQKADFERALAAPAKSRSAHFAVHHVSAAPLPLRQPATRLVFRNLSTTLAPGCPKPVDDLPVGHWIGCVVPKRHARRAVTRSLLKRQIRSAFAQHAARLPAGQWLVRLRLPFATTMFMSARSPALARAARDELDQLLSKASS